MTKKELVNCLEENMHCEICPLQKICKYNAGVPCSDLWLNAINEIIENEKELDKNA